MKILLAILTAMVVLISGCQAGWFDSQPVTSKSGLVMQSVTLGPVKDGMSLEQWNIKQRYIHDNKPDAIKYVYLVGPNGGVTQHFVISGKVTSSGKRLTPRTVANEMSSNSEGFDIPFGDRIYETQEVIEDDGTFGDSIPYVYMWTTKGNFVQVIPMGAFLMYVSDMQLTTSELTFTMVGE